MGAGARHVGGKVRQGKEVLGLNADHPGSDTRAELEDLASNVAEESIRGPTTN
jgi:hypothetical protein